MRKHLCWLLGHEPYFGAPSYEPVFDSPSYEKVSVDIRCEYCGASLGTKVFYSGTEPLIYQPGVTIPAEEQAFLAAAVEFAKACARCGYVMSSVNGKMTIGFESEDEASNAHTALAAMCVAFKKVWPPPTREPNFLGDVDADFCDRHETAFRMGDRCPKCHPPQTQGAADAAV